MICSSINGEKEGKSKSSLFVKSEIETEGMVSKEAKKKKRKTNSNDENSLTYFMSVSLTWNKTATSCLFSILLYDWSLF